MKFKEELKGNSVLSPEHIPNFHFRVGPYLPQNIVGNSAVSTSINMSSHIM